MKLKLKDEKGNTFVLVICILAIVTIFIGIISTYTLNQIKFNKNEEIYNESRYLSEAGIENIIAKYIKNISLDGNLENKNNNITQLYLNIVKQYLLESKYINVSNNNSNSNKTIDEVIRQIDMILPIINSDNFLGELSNLKNKFKILLTLNGIKDNVKNEIYKAEEYLYKLPYTSDNVETNINNLRKNILRNIELYKSHTKYKYSNLILIYQGMIDEISKPYEIELSDKFIDDSIKILTDIKEGKYLELLDLDKMHDDYKGNTNDYIDIYYNRIQISILELKLIKSIMSDNSDNAENDNGINDELYLYIDNEIELEDIDMNFNSKALIKGDVAYSDEYIEFIKTEKNKSIYKVKKKDAHIIIPLEIKSVANSKKSKSEEYKIKAESRIIIEKIQSDEEYTIKYEVVDWKKYNE